MWAYEGIFYQIYPIGFCGAPTANDGKTVSRILKLKDWSSYLESLGISSILLNPILNQIIMVMTPGIIKKSTAVSEPIKISQKYAKISIHTM